METTCRLWHGCLYQHWQCVTYSKCVGNFSHGAPIKKANEMALLIFPHHCGKEDIKISWGYIKHHLHLEYV